MSLRRRVLVGVVLVLVLTVAVVAGIRWVTSRGASVDPSARPPQDRPGTVLLVPGYGGGRSSLLALAARIQVTGRDARVLALAGDGTGDLSAQVRVLDDAVNAALGDGAPSVDVIGYSAGGVVVGLWIARDGGAARARRVVTLGAPLHGTTTAALGAAVVPDACPVACRQLARGSAELSEIDRAGVGADLPWLSVWTTGDETVTPPDSARLNGAVNVAVQAVCAGTRLSHSDLPTDPVVIGLVLSAIGVPPPVAPGEADCARLRAAGAR